MGRGAMTVTLFPRNSGFKLILSRREESGGAPLTKIISGAKHLSYTAAVLSPRLGGVRILDNEILKWHVVDIYGSSGLRPFEAKIKEEGSKSINFFLCNIVEYIDKLTLCERIHL